MKKLNLIPTPKEQEKDLDVIDIKEEDIDMGFFKGINSQELLRCSNASMAIRSSGKFAGKAIFLNPVFNYIIGRDDLNSPILIALKKK